MRPHNKHRILAKLATLSLLSLGILAVSCVSDDIGCIEDRPGYIEGNDLWMTISVVNQSSNIPSRADDEAGHPDEDAERAENYIDTDDITLMLLDANRILLKVFERDEFAVTPAQAFGEDLSKYDITFNVNRDYFNYANGLNDIPFSLMVVANTNGVRGGKPSLPFSWRNVGKKVASLSEDAGNMFEFPDSYDTPWRPSIADGGKHIPMAGIKKMSMTRTEFETGNTVATRVELGSIPMQRTLAKVRVLDGIRSQEDTEFSEITSVGLQGVFKSMGFVPYSSVVPGWYTADETPVIEKASVKYGEWDTTATIPFFEVDDYTATDGTTYKKAFVAYVPEYSASVKAESDTKRAGTDGYIVGEVPTLKFQLKEREAVASAEPVKRDVKLTSFANITDIARNHIYEFTVKANPNAKLDLTLNVKAWDRYEESIEFTDQPSFSDVVWSNIYSGWNYSTGEVRINPDVPAKVEFNLETPRDCRWTAYLIPIRGNGAFVFTDAAGNPLTENGGLPTGIIDPAIPTTLYIKATSPEVVSEVSAELCVMITTLDNTEIEAALAGNARESGRYLIRQIPNN